MLFDKESYLRKKLYINLKFVLFKGKKFSIFQTVKLFINIYYTKLNHFIKAFSYFLIIFHIHIFGNKCQKMKT